MNEITEQRQQDIIKQFEGIDDWFDKYEKLILIGSNQKRLDNSELNNDNIVPGCQSKVWIVIKRNEDNTFTIRAHSDTIIITGIITLIINVLNDLPKDEILSADIHFLNDIGLSEHLSPTRSNGIKAMLNKIYTTIQTY